MLANGAEDLRGQIGKARTTLARARDAPAVEGPLAPANRAGERLPLGEQGGEPHPVPGIVFDDDDEGGRLLGVGQ
jgi:hypothetical protein